VRENLWSQGARAHVICRVALPQCQAEYAADYHKDSDSLQAELHKSSRVIACHDHTCHSRAHATAPQHSRGGPSVDTVDQHMTVLWVRARTRSCIVGKPLSDRTHRCKSIVGWLCSDRTHRCKSIVGWLCSDRTHRCKSIVGWLRSDRTHRCKSIVGWLCSDRTHRCKSASLPVVEDLEAHHVCGAEAVVGHAEASGRCCAG
jgi:hypothetical protein